MDTDPVVDIDRHKHKHKQRDKQFSGYGHTYMFHVFYGEVPFVSIVSGTTGQRPGTEANTAPKMAEHPKVCSAELECSDWIPSSRCSSEHFSFQRVH